MHWKETFDQIEQEYACMKKINVRRIYRFLSAHKFFYQKILADVIPIFNICPSSFPQGVFDSMDG